MADPVAGPRPACCECGAVIGVVAPPLCYDCARRIAGNLLDAYRGARDDLLEWKRRAQVAEAALENFDPFRPAWPKGLEQGEVYQLACDDKGRNGASWAQVYVAPDCDVHLTMQDWEDYPEGAPSPMPSLRCRTHEGGGRNGRTHQALLWLAQAIRLDQDEQKRRRGDG